MTRDEIRAALNHEIQHDVYPVRRPRPTDTAREHQPGTLSGHLRFAAWTGLPLQPIVRQLPHDER